LNKVNHDGAVFNEELAQLADIADLSRVKLIMENPGTQPGFALFRARSTVTRAIRANATLKMRILSPNEAKAWLEAVGEEDDDSLKGTSITLWDQIFALAPKEEETFEAYVVRQNRLLREGKMTRRGQMAAAAIFTMPCAVLFVLILQGLGVLVRDTREIKDNTDEPVGTGTTT